MAYVSARTVEEALAALAAGPARVIAGGTDVFPALGDRPLTGDVVDVSRTEGLRGIGRDAAGWRIGAATTWSDLVRTPLPAAFDGLKAAAREVGAVQIQNTATLAGNLVTASPAADGVPCLLALEAEVELASARGRRTLPLGAFLTGARATALAPDELVTAIRVFDLPAAARGGFLKLGARRYLVISIAMASAVIVPAGGRVAEARIAVGACSPVARRLTDLEAALTGAPLETLAECVGAGHFAPLSPIDDVRGSAAYRLDAAAELVRRLLAGFAPARAAAA